MSWVFFLIIKISSILKVYCCEWHLILVIPLTKCVNFSWLYIFFISLVFVTFTWMSLNHATLVTEERRLWNNAPVRLAMLVYHVRYGVIHYFLFFIQKFWSRNKLIYINRQKYTNIDVYFFIFLIWFQDCATGYTRSEGGLYIGLCEPCQCNGHATDCDPETGVCRVGQSSKFNS